MKIAIDARLYGPKHTGNGRYTKELIDNLVKIDPKNDYYVLLRQEDYDLLRFPKNFTKILAEFNHYTFSEQFKLPLILNKIKPDLVHFPHFNVSILYFGKFIVTIHDLIMHKFTDGSATTRGFLKYFVWRIGYHIAFLKAVYGSIKIIVPSNAIKNELSDYYKLNKNKIVVTYE